MRSLLKALLTTGGAAVVAQILGLIVNKILALTVGASGIGFYSLMRQVHDTAAGLGGIGAGGLVQGLAAREGVARSRLWWAAIILSAIGAMVAGAVLLLAARPIAQALFDRDDALTIGAVAICAITATLGILQMTLAAAVNAARAISALALLSVGGAVVLVLIAWPVGSEARTQPYLLALLIGAPLFFQSVAALLVLRRLGWLPGRLTASTRPGAGELRYFAGFFGFNLALIAMGSFCLLFLRAGIVHAEGLAADGIFAAGWGLGMQSLSLILGSFGTYVLPSLAAGDADQRRKLLQDSATLVLAATLPLLVGLIAWKSLVVRLLFSAEFLPAVNLLQWLLLGNYVKALAWVFAVPLLATADLRRYFLVETVWYAGLAGGSAIAFLSSAPLEGIGMAFLGGYTLYLLLAGYLAHARFAFRLSRRSLASFLVGLLLLAATAALTWGETTMDWPVAVAAPLVAAVVALLTLTPQHRAKGWALLRLKALRR